MNESKYLQNEDFLTLENDVLSCVDIKGRSISTIGEIFFTKKAFFYIPHFALKSYDNQKGVGEVARYLYKLRTGTKFGIAELPYKYGSGIHELATFADAIYALVEKKWGNPISQRINSGIADAIGIDRTSFRSVHYEMDEIRYNVTVTLTSNKKVIFGSAFPPRLATTIQEWAEGSLKVNNGFLISLFNCPKWTTLVHDLARGQKLNLEPRYLELMGTTDYAHLFFNDLIKRTTPEIKRVEATLRGYQDPFSIKIQGKLIMKSLKTAKKWLWSLFGIAVYCLLGAFFGDSAMPWIPLIIGIFAIAGIIYKWKDYSRLSTALAQSEG